MFGLFDLFVKRVNDQAAEYAATQSRIARRSWNEWVAPFNTLQPVKIAVDRSVRGAMRHRDPAGHRSST